MKKSFLSPLLMILLLTACGFVGEDDKTPDDAALLWAEAYFNCDYQKALQHTTPESRQWLHFAASNTTQQDLTQLQDKGWATAHVLDSDDTSDSTATVTLTVSHYLETRGMSDSSRVATDGRFRADMVLRNGHWLIRMEGLPRSEKHSRD